MTDVVRRSGRRLPAALLVVAIVLGLGACEVHRSTLVEGPAEVDVVKECDPARTAVLAVNIGDVRHDVLITTDGVLRARKAGVAPGSALHWSGAVDATQVQVGFYRPGGGGGDHLVVERVPDCPG